MLTDEHLVARAKDGDELAFVALARRYERLTQHYARKRYGPGLEQQDLDQEAVIGLWGAVRSFDVERGVPFYALAHLAVSRWLDTVVIAALRQKHRVLSGALSLDTSEAGDYNEPFYTAVEDPLSVDPAVALERKEALATVVNVVAHRLSPLERAVVVGLVNGETYLETADRLGLESREFPNGKTRSKAVDNALQRARRKVLAALEEAA